MSHPNDALIAELLARLPGCRAPISGRMLHGEVAVSQVVKRLMELGFRLPSSPRKRERDTPEEETIERILRNILAGELVSESVLRDMMRLVSANLRIEFDSAKEPMLVEGKKVWFSSSKERPELIEQIRARGVLRVGLLKTPWLVRYQQLYHGPTESCIQAHLRAMDLRDYRIFIAADLGTLLERLGNKSAIDVAFGVPATGQERLSCIKKSFQVGHLTEVHEEAVYRIRSTTPQTDATNGVVVVKHSPEHLFIAATWPRSSRNAIQAIKGDYKDLFRHLDNNPQTSGLIPASQKSGLPASIKVVNEQPVAILRFSDAWNMRRMPLLFR